MDADSSWCRIRTFIYSHYFAGIKHFECQEIGQGAAFTGMMRQLGGSFGIAAITPFIAKQTTIHRAALSKHLDAAQQIVNALSNLFLAKGFTVDNAKAAAYKI